MEPKVTPYNNPNLIIDTVTDFIDSPYLSTSFFSPHKAATVLTAERACLATAPAFWYTVTFLLPKVDNTLAYKVPDIPMKGMIPEMIRASYQPLR